MFAGLLGGTTDSDIRAADDLGVRSLWPMRYAMHERDAADGRLFDADRGCTLFSQRTTTLSGAIDAPGVGRGPLRARRRWDCSHRRARARARPSTALFVARDVAWRLDGEVRALSVLVHDAAPSSVSHAVVDLDEVETGTATAGRQFLLGVTPEQGCASVTQFIGLVPPGRAPDDFHTYDEVIYVLDGEGTLFIGGEEAELRAGSCVYLPAPRPLPGEHGRERAAAARRLSAGRLAGRGLLPRRHTRRPTRRRPPSAEDRTLCRRQLGRGCGAWRGRAHGRVGRLQRTAVLAADPHRTGRRGRRARRSCSRRMRDA